MTPDNESLDELWLDLQQDNTADEGIEGQEEISVDIADIGVDSQSLKRDVILVLDNSGSMKRNDPDFLANHAVIEFIGDLDASTRIDIVIFDQDVNLAVSLTPVTFGLRADILNSLEKINYQGLFTDSTAVIERAIYELKNSERDDARKLIIFVTDGIVDT